MDPKQLKLSKVKFLDRIMLHAQGSIDNIGMPRAAALGGPLPGDVPYQAFFVPEFQCVRITRAAQGTGSGKFGAMDVLVPVSQVNWMEVYREPPPPTTAKKVD